MKRWRKALVANLAEFSSDKPAHSAGKVIYSRQPQEESQTIPKQPDTKIRKKTFQNQTDKKGMIHPRLQVPSAHR